MKTELKAKLWNIFVVLFWIWLLWTVVSVLVYGQAEQDKYVFDIRLEQKRKLTDKVFSQIEQINKKTGEANSLWQSFFVKNEKGEFTGFDLNKFDEKKLLQKVREIREEYDEFERLLLKGGEP